MEKIQFHTKLSQTQIKVNEILSDTNVLTWGIPQGSVVSPIFLVLKLYKIIAQLPIANRFQISLYILDWKAHTQQLKFKCDKTISLMWNVSSTKWGADQKTLKVTYRSLIRSKIDYGCIVYNFASMRELVSLESVSNEAMRKSSRCFKSTRISSLKLSQNNVCSR